MLNFIFVLFFATSPIITSVVKGRTFCGSNEFPCNDGSCVSMDFLCLGGNACADGSDQRFCAQYLNQISFGQPVLNRTKRQSQCLKNQWQCRDRSCVQFYEKCDGVANCPDGSDETHPLCRNTECQSNLFRCAYGACVDGTAPCNGVQDCADNSDEENPICFSTKDQERGRFKCQNGQLISSTSLCDGIPDCSDGSDETIRACATESCPSHLFQCAYGACVDQGSNCNGRNECADGSDESDELCNRTSAVTVSPSISKPSSRLCVLPPYPENGRYSLPDAKSASPGQRFESISLKVSCDPGYGVYSTDDKSGYFCLNGIWVGDMPSCIRFCKLSIHPSVEYKCKEIRKLGNREEKITRDCQEYEPSGLTVMPTCRINYYSDIPLSSMRCVEGSWNYVAKCKPECGTVTQIGDSLIITGRHAERGELPWHAGIYDKLSNPYEQICGGSLVTSTVVISAAHCFWKDEKKPASDFAAAVGKIYRPWSDPMEADAQKSNISDIKMPPRYNGVLANYQEDIALVFLSTVIEYKPYIRPVCLDFNKDFNNKQLREGNLGKVAGWGYTTEDGKPSPTLKVVDLPYVDIYKCINESPLSFQEYITSDKICAGYKNGTALCKGDSGGGLVFPDENRGKTRFYLRGIVSTAPANTNQCNAYVYTSFTLITQHSEFIADNVDFENT